MLQVELVLTDNEYTRKMWCVSPSYSHTCLKTFCKWHCGIILLANHA